MNNQEKGLLDLSLDAHVAYVPSFGRGHND